MPTIEWDIPFSLVSNSGTLVLNAASGNRYVLDHEACWARPNLRVSFDPLPRADGMTIYHTFKTGYMMELVMSLWVDDKPAMGADATAMCDALDPFLTDLLNADILTDAGGRVIWTPSSYTDDRMLDGCRLRDWASVKSNGFTTEVTLPLHSRFPYGIDATQISTGFSGTQTVTVTNAGNVEQWPVFKVYGATSAFTVANLTTDRIIVYDASLPGGVAIGGGDYVEIDMFRNTLYLNGNSANRKAGVDLLLSDFWSLIPGDNDIETTGVGAGTVLLSNNAWA